MAIVRISKGPITPHDKKAAIDLKVKYNYLERLNNKLMIALIFSILGNVIQIIMKLVG